MDTQQERLSHLDRALSNGENICSSEGMLCSFPASLKKPFMINGAGLMVCRQGNFTFSLNMKVFSAQAGETVFIPEDSLFQVLSESEDLQLFIFIYQIEPIRDIIGNSVATMYLYMQLRTEPCYVWSRGDGRTGTGDRDGRTGHYERAGSNTGRDGKSRESRR